MSCRTPTTPTAADDDEDGDRQEGPDPTFEIRERVALAHHCHVAIPLRRFAAAIGVERLGRPSAPAAA
jgi:hypothetical protein